MGSKQSKKKRSDKKSKSKSNKKSNVNNNNYNNEDEDDSNSANNIKLVELRIAEKIINDDQLLFILKNSINDTRILPKGLSNAVRTKFKTISAGMQTVSIQELTKLPEFSIHPFYRRMFEVLIDIFNEKSPQRSFPSKRLKRTQTQKSSQYYGCTFSEQGPLGIALRGDASTGTGKGILVQNIMNGTLASKGGKVQVGDTFVSVNGISTENMNVSQALKLIGSYGRPLHLRFKRERTSGKNNRSFRYSHVFDKGKIGLRLNQHKYQQQNNSSLTGVKSIYGGQFAPLNINSIITTNKKNLSNVFVSDIEKNTQAWKKINPIIQKNDYLLAINSTDVSKYTQKQVIQQISRARRPINLQFYRPKKPPLSSGNGDTSNTDRSLLTWQSKIDNKIDIDVRGGKFNRAETISLTYAVRQDSPSSKDLANLDILLAACVVCSSNVDPGVKDAVAFKIYGKHYNNKFDIFC